VILGRGFAGMATAEQLERVSTSVDLPVGLSISSMPAR
jgi:hypothetical protein